MKTLALWIGILSSLFLSATAKAVDLAEIERALTTTGVEGEVHGASPEQNLYVFTYRSPSNFFDFIQMSLVSFDPAIQAQLKALHRHDRIRVQGAFLDNPSPQKHIEIKTLEVVRTHQSPYPVPEYSHEAKIPDELLGKSSATFLVHALFAEGHILVVEYKDTVIPIHVKNNELTRHLFRGDLVRLSFKIQRHPHQPVHLRLNEGEPTSPVEVLESIQAKHGQPALVEGYLVLFPKSPEIIFNVFAVLEELPEGLKRQYTLVNFESPEIFKQIRTKLQAAWDRHATDYVNGRNKLVSTHVRVRAKGIFNEVDANQANPQILLSSEASIEVISD